MENGIPAEGHAPEADDATELQPGASADPVDGVALNGEPQNVEEQSSEAGAGARAEEDKTKKNQERFDRRFSDLSRRAREAELKAAKLEGELEAMRRGSAPKPQEQAAGNADPEPDPTKFPGGEYAPEYLRELARWEGRQAFRQEREAAAKAEATAKERAEREAIEAEGVKRFRATHEMALSLGYEGGADLIADVLPREVVDDITETENPAHVAEWLARNRAVADSLIGMNPRQRLRTIGALDAEISRVLETQKEAASAKPQAQNAPTPPATTSKHALQPSPAPAPQAPARGASPILDPNKLSMDEYANARTAGRI